LPKNRQKRQAVVLKKCQLARHKESRSEDQEIVSQCKYHHKAVQTWLQKKEEKKKRKKRKRKKFFQSIIVCALEAFEVKQCEVIWISITN
jgi:uncharacterized Rmd1/YagE family protein